METHFRELDEQGYTVLENLLTPRQVEAAIEALRESYQEVHVSAHEPGTLRTHNLTARAEIFRENILPKMENALEIARETYEIGDIAILEVLDAYRSLSESRLSYLRDLFQAHLASIELDRLSAATPTIGKD